MEGLDKKNETIKFIFIIVTLYNCIIVVNFFLECNRE